MKNKIKPILLGLSFVFGVIAFAMLFVTPLAIAHEIKDPAILGILNDLGFNNGEFLWQPFYFGNENGEGQHLLGFFGFLMMGIAAIVAVLTAAVSTKKGKNILTFILGFVGVALFAVGVILTFSVKADVIKSATEGIEIEALKNKVVEVFNESLKLGTGPIVGGAFGIAGALFTLVGIVIPGPKKAKKGKRK